MAGLLFSFFFPRRNKKGCHGSSKINRQFSMTRGNLKSLLSSLTMTITNLISYIC